LTGLIDAQTVKTEDNIQKYKAILDYKDSTVNAELSDEAATRVRQGLTFERQYLVYLDALREQCQQAQSQMVKFRVAHEETLNDIKFVCKAKSAVPVDQVYVRL
jgi:hypothetical protein